jgi:hypothetical protein
MRGSSEKVYASSSFINLLSVASPSPDNGTVSRLQVQAIADAAEHALQVQAPCQSLHGSINSDHDMLAGCLSCAPVLIQKTEG